MVKFMLWIFYHNLKKTTVIPKPKPIDFGLSNSVNGDLFTKIRQNVAGAALDRKRVLGCVKLDANLTIR